MSLVLNPVTKTYEADLRSKGLGRLHVSLRTKRKGEADDRHAAVKALFLEGNRELIDAVRNRKIPVEAITRVHKARKPFDSLLAKTAWPTIKDAADQYLEAMSTTDRAEGTKGASKQLLNQAIEYFGENRALDSISHEEIEEYKLMLLARGMKPWSAGLHLTRLNALFTWLRRREEREAGRENRQPRSLRTPIDREIIPPRTASRDRFLSREEAQKLLAATPDDLLFPVACGLLAGLRIGEVITLRPPPQDFNLEVAGGVILVQEKEGWRPKSKKRRQIPIAEELRPLLDRHVQRYSGDGWMMPVLRNARKKSTHWRVSTLEKHFRQIVENAGLISGQKHAAGVTFHTLRHTFASWLVMSGVDLYTVSKLLGHSNIKLVEQTYGHLAPDFLRTAIHALDQKYKLGFELPNDNATDTTKDPATEAI